MKKAKTARIGISLALAFSLALNVFASNGTGALLEVEQAPETAQPQAYTASPIVEEDVSKRGEYEKHFICEDGSYIAATYPYAVHEKDENGEWVDIDNSLAFKNNRIENQSAVNGVSFAPSANAERLASAEFDGYQVEWSLTQNVMQPTQTISNKLNGPTPAFTIRERPLNAVKAQIKPAEKSAEVKTVEEINEEKMTLENLTSSILYENAMGEGIDVRYTVIPGKVKEDIILNQPSGFESYTMHIDAGGLTAVKLDDNSVNFVNEKGETIFTTFTPYMYDAANEYSFEIEVGVEQDENGCKITFIPSREWLTAPERVYPITIDPSNGQNGANYDDTYVHESDNISGSNGTCTVCGVEHNKDIRMYAGIRNGRVHRAFFKIKTLPSMASNCSVYNAKMKINCWYGTSTGRAFSLAHVQQSWNHETIIWTNKPTSFTTVASNVERLSDNSVNFSGEAVNRMVQYWYTNGNNYGCSISYTNESKTNPDYNAFYSSNCDVSYNVKRPLLSFSYVQPENLPDGIYFMGNRNSKMVMDVLHAGGPGAQVVQFTYHGNTNQYWFFTRQSDGSYIITPTYNTNLALEVKGGGTGNNKLVQVNTKTGASNQRWFIYDNMNGYYRIMSKCSYQCQGLRPQDGSTTERAPIVQYDLYGYPSSWEITPPEYGNGGAYRQVNGYPPQCFGYAMFLNTAAGVAFGILDTSHETESYSNKFKSAIENVGYSCRRISSFTSPIESNEYRVAVRAPNFLDGVHRYHVIYQLSDGTWAGKDYDKNSQHFGYDNPSTTKAMWSNDAYSPAAGTIYFAVKR